MPRGSPLSGWRERAFGETQAAALENAGYPRLLARLLAARGVTAETAAAYFSPSLADLSSPGDLPGIGTAVCEILSSLARGERIVVFGDYDCDGVCATAIVMAALGVLARPDAPPPQAFLPERLTEGYGMSAASVARLLDENPDVRLIVTVDNGINAVSAVTELAARGIKVVVTDHHLPGEELPAAAALVNPKVSAPPRLEGLCGAGVAFLLAKALVTAAKERGLYAGPPVGGPLLVLAGLATVTDVMPVTGENRILVSEALRRFRTWAPMGLKELFLRVSRSAAATLVTKDFSFLIGPRINAAGRLASGMDALNLILTTDREEARELARQVDLRNIERKSIEQEMLKAALEQLIPGAPAQVINLPDGHEGVAGIVAARILEQTAALPGAAGSVPVAVIVRGRGSARAPAGCNVRDALAAAAETLHRYGGHAAAGGFSVKDGAVGRFRDLFTAACARQAAADPADVRAGSVLDGWVSPAELTLDFAQEIQKMEPFGEGNPEPVFGIRSVRFADVRPIGADGRHLSLTFRDRTIPKAIWWNRGDRVEELRARTTASDIVFTVEVNDYQQRHVELRLVDLTPAAPVGHLSAEGGRE